MLLRATLPRLFLVRETDGTDVALRVLRHSAGLTVRELARMAGVSPSYLSRVENGDVQPTDRWVRDVICQVGQCMRAA